MFYEPNKRNHGLSHDPFKALVAPRPIGWITSMSAKGEINLAPYSHFNAVLTSSPMVMFASDAWKDTIAFVEETMRPIGRAGYHEYFVATLDTKFSLQRPTTVGSALPDDLTNA